MNIRNLIDKLADTHILTKEELVYIIKNINDEDRKYLHKKASCLRDKYYSNKVYLRALIEFTNYCKNDCYYCGIRKSNKNADRYRLSLDEIMECADIGHTLGYNTYVLQGGEDPYFTDDKIVEIVKSIKSKYPNCAVTLSIGEKSYESYKKYYDAGADRYLLRHETANEEHYKKTSPRMYVTPKQNSMFKKLKRNRLSDRCWIYGSFSLSNTRNFSRRFAILKRTGPTYGWNRPFYPTSRYSI